MQIIAITGRPGSGKTAVSRVLEKKGYSRVRFGDITDDEIKKRGLEFNEQNEEMVRDELRKTHGMEAYAKLSVPRIEKHEKVVIDGLYSYDEYDFLKGKYEWFEYVKSDHINVIVSHIIAELLDNINCV